MKKYLSLFFILLLAISLMTGCRSKQDNPTAGNTNNTNSDLLPDMNDMIPDAADTIDPSNGANPNTEPPASSQNDTTGNNSTGADDSGNGLENNGRSRVFPRQ